MTSFNFYFNSSFQIKVVNKIEKILAGHFKRNFKQIKKIKVN